MYNINIPPEALEAAADKIEGQCPCMSRDSAIETARAACIAMLRAWPGAVWRESGVGREIVSRRIVLPLPPEKETSE